jgi:hypothetical protein
MAHVRKTATGDYSPQFVAPSGTLMIMSRIKY